MATYDHLNPGDEGYWPVIGACVGSCIKAGDRITEGDETYIVDAVFEAKAAPLRVGIVVGGERQTIGALARVKRDRLGTSGTLCRSCVR